MITISDFLLVSGFGAFAGVLVIGGYWLAGKIFSKTIDVVIDLLRNRKRK